MPILPWVYLWLDKICWLTCVTFMALNVCLYLGRILVYNSSLYYCKSKLRLYNIIKKIHNFFILHYTSIYEVYLYISKNVWKNLIHFLRLNCLKDDSAHNFWIVNNSLDQCIGKKVWFYLRSWFILYIHLLPFFELKRNKKFRLVSYILTFVWLPNSLEVWMTDDFFIWCILKSLKYENIIFVALLKMSNLSQYST